MRTKATKRKLPRNITLSDFAFDGGRKLASLHGLDFSPFVEMIIRREMVSAGMPSEEEEAASKRSQPTEL